ncbi:hypothetical protein ABW19_dt0202929 [Dactylella cylindrospora]|nr:hypothetical protein ABW19_dt0202929 [Dactylella cylindrospora]
MAGDNVEEISIEETNRIRASLGLKPLRVDTAPPPPPPEEKPPKQDGDDSISIEETNRIRAALGLKPLKTDTSAASAADDNSFDAQERRAVDNWKKHQDDLDKKKQREQIKEEIRKAKDKALREQKLEGKGLADDDDEEDALTWLKKAKKRQKKAALQMEKDLAAREEEEERMRKEYTSKDLAGLKVGHDVDEFGDAIDGAILTLKDSEILGGEDDEGISRWLRSLSYDEQDTNYGIGDELENASLVERQKLKEKLDSKKRKPDYNPYGDDDDAGESTILSKYDDEIEPNKKRKHFILDNSGSTTAILSKDAQRQKQISEKLKKIPISLDILNTTEEPSDYVDPSTIKVKKPKKKKVRTQRRVAEEDDDIFLPEAVAINASSSNANGSGGGAMSIDSTESRPRKVFEESFVDDEDLSAALTIQRRAALKKQKALKPEELARKLKEEAADEMKDDDEEAPGMIIDDTTEFVSSLQAPIITERRPRAAAKPKVKDEEEEASSPDADGDVAMDGADFGKSMSPEAESVKKERSNSAVPEITSTGLEEETTIGIGLASTLSMLRQRQLLDTQVDPDAHNKMQDKEAFLARQRVAQAEADRRAKAARERDRKSGKFDKMSAREKEEYARYENKIRDQQEAREAAARFKDYKPDVKIEYKDEYGRAMNQKEAFKYLSHQFHGKGSGKQKTEKKLKKIEDEKKRMAASSLNPEGSVGTIADTAKKSRMAGVRLM